MVNRKEHKLLPYLMSAPAFLLMVVVVIIPVLCTVNQSFHNEQGQWTLENYQYFLRSPEAWQSLGFTLVTALTITVLAVSLSFLLVLYLRFSKSPISQLLSKIYLLPRFIPGIAAVYAVMNLIKDSGFINRFLLQFGIDFKPGLLFDMKGIVLSSLWFSIPFVAMTLSAALSNVNDSFVESARDEGASWLTVICKIVLPLTYKDIVISATFILMGQIGSFTIPYLTGPNNPKMLGILLYQQSATYMNYYHAAALSVIMFVLCIGGAFVYIKTNMKEDVWEQG